MSLIDALARSVGAQIDLQKPDVNGVDCTITRPSDYSGISIQIQAKTRQAPIPDSASWSYDLDVPTYNKLVARVPPTVVKILVVHFIPPSAPEWIQADAGSYLVRNMSYWAKMTGLPRTENRTTQAVHFESANVFTRDTIADLLNGARDSARDLFPEAEFA